MANILFLAHRIPYPPNKGDKIRSWNFLKRLAEHHTVHAGFYVDDPRDLDYISLLEGSVASLSYEEVSPLQQKIRSLSGFLTGKSLTESAYPYSKLKKYANDLFLNKKIDLVFLFSAATAPIVLGNFSGPIIADLVDVDSEKWLAYSKASAWPISWIFRREARLLAKFEAKVAGNAEATLFVSEDETHLFCARHPELVETTVSVKNGVDLVQFNSANYPNVQSGKSLIFTGAMDYQPNIEAVEWFCRQVWPLIYKKHPDATFQIAGGSAGLRVKALEATEGVSVLGYVEDMAEALSRASIVVAPLQTARGIQNKVLEAMAMAKPVVATSLANEGINGEDGKQLLVANTAKSFASAVFSLIDSAEKRAELGTEGRTFVEKGFSWQRSFEELNRLISRGTNGR